MVLISLFVAISIGFALYSAGSVGIWSTHVLLKSFFDLINF